MNSSRTGTKTTSPRSKRGNLRSPLFSKAKRSKVTPLATAILAASLPSVVLASTATWTGGAGASWDTSATNWSNVSGTPWDITNGLTNAALFNTAGATPLVSGTVWANSLTFGQTATISNGTITLAGVSPTITTNANATIGSVLAGTAGITKAGTGILTLTGSNTFSGGISFTGSTLVVGAAGALRGRSGRAR